jgi:Holliday junction resolvasome RuvABC endonuclease subunit
LLSIGLDCSGRRVGWAITNTVDGAPLESGVREFARKRGESVGMTYFRFRSWVDSLVSTAMEVASGDEEIVLAYEAALRRGGHATEMAFAEQTRAQEVAASHGIVSVPVHPGTAKKFATGRGNCGKPEMIEEARKLLGRDPEDDNEADAIHIARYAVAEFGVDPDTAKPRMALVRRGDDAEASGRMSDLVVVPARVIREKYGDPTEPGLLFEEDGVSYAVVAVCTFRSSLEAIDGE